MIMDIVTLGSSKSAKGHARHIAHPKGQTRIPFTFKWRFQGTSKPAQVTEPVKGRDRNVNLDLSTPKLFYERLMSFQGNIQHAKNSKKRKRNIVLISKEGNSPFYKRKITRPKLC